MARHPVDDSLEKWTQALRRSDVDTLVSLITTDCEFWSPGQPPQTGREAVRQAFATVFEKYKIDQIFEERERIVTGDWVLLRGIEKNVITPRKGVGETTVLQRVFTLAHRDADGVWRFARGISQFVAP